MKRYTQTLEELLSLLSPVDTTWMDDHSTAVIGAMSNLPIRDEYEREDILRDIQRVVAKKRPDTNLLLVTDGISWRLRRNDLQTLVDWQREGQIMRIYTQQMASDLEDDLKQLREEHGL